MHQHAGGVDGARGEVYVRVSVHADHWPALRMYVLCVPPACQLNFVWLRVLMQLCGCAVNISTVVSATQLVFGPENGASAAVSLPALVVVFPARASPKSVTPF